MAYVVIAPDGAEYGPVDLSQLNQWHQEGRVTPTTTLRDTLTNRTVLASVVLGLNHNPYAQQNQTRAPLGQARPKKQRSVGDDLKDTLSSQSWDYWICVFLSFMSIVISLVGLRSIYLTVIAGVFLIRSKIEEDYLLWIPILLVVFAIFLFALPFVRLAMQPAQD